MNDTSSDAERLGYAVIMAGGRGTRFWPLSRACRPKQLLSLFSSQSLLRETYLRIAPLFGPERILVVTTANLAAAVVAELPELRADHVLAEPAGRNTAPCAALGIAIAQQLGGPGPVTLLPADHWIPDGEIFRRQLSAGLTHAAATGSPVTFGVAPTRPETGFGYIEVKERTQTDSPDHGTVFLPGLRFTEKPDGSLARTFLADGRHYWNSGIFVWQSEAFAAALVRLEPEVARAMADLPAAWREGRMEAALVEAYAECPSVSLDHGLMEKLADFAVLPAAFRWSDLGGWVAWGHMAAALPGGNRGRAHLQSLCSRGNVVYAEGKTVALIGVEDLVVVDTPDALLVCRSEEAQRIKDLIAQLEATDRNDLL
jgi:mannose-1-phosphate guanylyltransferase